MTARLRLYFAPRPLPAGGQAVTVPNEGDTVIIECDGQRHRATVGPKAPRGDFSVDWYAGRNRYAPHLPGHWYAEFGPNGEPKHNWRIVEIVNG